MFVLSIIFFDRKCPTECDRDRKLPKIRTGHGQEIFIFLLALTDRTGPNLTASTPGTIPSIYATIHVEHVRFPSLLFAFLFNF